MVLGIFKNFPFGEIDVEKQKKWEKSYPHVDKIVDKMWISFLNLWINCG